MVSFFKQIFKQSVIYAVTLIVLGLIFIVWPAASRGVLVRILGIALILAGVALTISYFTRYLGKMFPTTAICGIIIVIIGIMITAKPEYFTAFVMIVLGIFVGISGIMNFLQTMSLASLHYKYWWIGLILSVVTIICSVLIITKPGKIADILFVISGIFMIYDGLSDLFFALKLRSLSTGAKKSIESGLDDLQ